MRSSNTLKIISALILLVIMILGIGIYSNNVLTTSSKKMEDMVVRIEENAKAGNWEKAQEELSIIEKDWYKTKKSWAMLIDHLEIDNIDTALTRMTEYIKAGESSLALAEASLLKQFVRHVPVKDALRLENVL